ncbi:mechanosensitive ion channel domain-containing protein [Thioalkalivibrio sp.]|uniref:mechanosensitive ion channel family protein n=1 Tax=Thioalkalivibrio sp. TaxID=2093813 RepID=UPI0025EA1C5E|nr:mechanosensitive ion channel domain-containing protein [Thioalkalivibrio sp.]
MRRILLIALVSVLAALSVWSAALAQEEEGPGLFAFEVSAINEGLPALESPLRLDTPRAALESFLAAIDQREYARAAQALNLSAIDPEEQASRGPDLALKLAFLLRRHNLIDWADMPDQPDARVLPDVQQSFGPYSRRSVDLGEVDVDGRATPISLQRFHTDDSEAVWLFSPFVVERIDAMFADSPLGIFVRWMPLEERVHTVGQPSAWEWLTAAILLAFSLLLWFGLYYLTRALTLRVPLRWTLAVRKIPLPLATVVAALAFRFGTVHLVVLTGPVVSNLDIASEMVALIAGAWLLLSTVSAVTLALSVRYIVPLSLENPENRRTKTTVYVVRRVAVVVVALLSVGYVLLKTGVFENFGLSVLASVGALGILVAIAARPLLGNMVAGLQIALAEPLRIGDVIVYDDHWATVEDISFAHTVLRTWRNTRLIVPHEHFLSRPFENCSKEGEAVGRIVKIPVDYRIDVEQVRRKVEEIVAGDTRSTGEPPSVEMVEVDGEAAVLWIWISGTTAFTSWYLHNHVREQVVAFLKELDGGAYLPRRRHILLSGSEDEAGPEPLGRTNVTR